MIKEICGVEALNDFLFSTKREAKVVSMDTLIRIAEDNDITLVPFAVVTEDLKKVKPPFILFHRLDYGKGDGHFSLIADKEMLDSVNLGEVAYILSDKIVADIEGTIRYTVLNEQGAKQLKGSKKKTFFGQLFRKPQNILPQIGLGIATALTGGAALPALLAGGAYGAYRGYREAPRVGQTGLTGALTGAVKGAALTGGAGALTTGAKSLLAGSTAAPTLTPAAVMGPGYGYQGSIPGAMGAGITPSAGLSQLATAGIESMRPALLAKGITPETMLPKATAAIGGIGTDGVASTFGGAAPLLAGQAGQAGQVATEAAKKTLLQRMTPYLTGAGLLGASTLVPQPEYPELPAIEPFGERTRALLGELPSAPLRTAASEELLKRIQAPLGSMMAPEVDPYSKEAIRLHTEAYDRKKEQIDQMFNFHGAFGSGEHRQALIDLEEEKSRGIAQLEQESLYRAQQLELDIKTSAIATGLGVSESDARILLSMLEQEQAKELGIYTEEAGGAAGLQETLGETGGKLISRALLPEQQSWLDRLLEQQYQKSLLGGTT